MRVLVSFGVAALMALALSAQSPPAPSAEVTLVDGVLTVDGLAAGATVVVLAIAHERPAHTLRLLRRELIAVDEDRDGRVEVEAARISVSPAVLAVADLTGGAVSLLRTDERGEARAFRLPGSDGVRSGESGSTELVLSEPADLDLVLARRGTAGAVGKAWGLRGSDGSDFDQSGEPGDADGSIVAPLGVLWPITNSGPPPEALAVGDLLLVIDPNDLAAGIFELGTKGWVAR